MALIVEDGTGIADADSLVSVADVTAFFEARGFDAPTIGYEPVLLQAMDAMSSLSYSGVKSYTVNDLPFPRIGLLDVANIAYPTTTVPRAAQRAQLWLAYYISEGFDPNAGPTPVVKMEKASSLETEYSTSATETMRTTTIYDLPNTYAALQHMLSTSEYRDSRRVIRA